MECGVDFPYQNVTIVITIIVITIITVEVGVDFPYQKMEYGIQVRSDRYYDYFGGRSRFSLINNVELGVQIRDDRFILLDEYLLDEHR